MQTYDEQIFRQHTDLSVTGGTSNSALSHLGVLAEATSLAGDHNNPRPGGESLDAVGLNNNQWSMIVEGTFTTIIPQSVVAMVLPEWTDEPEAYHTESDPTNLTFADAAPTFEAPPPEVPSSNSHTVPNIHWDPFRCSWHLHDSDAQCHHVAPDRAEFLRHLGAIHNVSGQQNAIITCRLYDHNTNSVCNTPIRRGSFPRHADTHYRVRYYCEHCPPGKSFSRQDSWMKHMKDKHAQVAIPEK